MPAGRCILLTAWASIVAPVGLRVRGACSVSCPARRCETASAARLRQLLYCANGTEETGMLRWAHAAIAMIAVAMPALAQPSPSFDCRKAAGAVDRAICGDAALAGQ